MKNRIDRRFEALAAQEKKALIPFITAGDPDPEWTVEILHELVRSGASVLEIGVPFSDPTADGTVIQQASERAIECGVTLAQILKMVEEFRTADQETPIILMGYLNPVERYGIAQFIADASAAGVDGLLMVDCPPEEMTTMRSAMDEQGLYSICLVAPTTSDERLNGISSQAQGFIYTVSFKGITGADRLDTELVADAVARIRAVSELPVAVGFGIKDAESATAVARHADAVVIGSALVARLATANSRDEALDAVRTYLAPIGAAMDNGIQEQYL